jgi:hypothetical protein
MRLSKQRRHVAKMQAREQSMVGWNQIPRDSGKQQMVASRSSQRMMPLGCGFHFARSLKSHV